MRVLKVVLEGTTTSFRYPHFMLSIQPSFPLPPRRRSTVIFAAPSASGSRLKGCGLPITLPSPESARIWSTFTSSRRQEEN